MKYIRTVFYANENGYGQWKYIKSRIKNILDEKQSSRYEKILKIEALLEDYKKRYLND